MIYLLGILGGSILFTSGFSIGVLWCKRIVEQEFARAGGRR